MPDFATPETIERAITVPSCFSSFDVDIDASPFSLIESNHAQGTASHVADEDRDPDVDRLKRSELPEKETDAQRHYDLRDDRNIKRAPRVTSTLKTAGVRESN